MMPGTNARGAMSCLLAGCLALAALAVPATAGAAPKAGGARAGRRVGDREIVADLTRLHVYKQTGIAQGKLRVRVEALSGGYARARVTTTDRSTDPAKVYRRKRGRAWAVIAGPGTHFTARELQRLGVPRSVR